MNIFHGLTEDKFCIAYLSKDEKGIFPTYFCSPKASKWCALGWIFRAKELGSIGEIERQDLIRKMSELASNMLGRDPEMDSDIGEYYVISEANDKFGYRFVEALQGVE
ncbi:MAG: hypothetical protein ACREBU_00820 [Nitrososphaera sp.]